ncbi:hypothetical protein OPQ81_007322 [Rhizoctonia solani]|nr:hypothetical protein OPQ81_007322 [Rhizoctonia solani]
MTRDPANFDVVEGGFFKKFVCHLVKGDGCVLAWVFGEEGDGRHCSLVVCKQYNGVGLKPASMGGSLFQSKSKCEHFHVENFESGPKVGTVVVDFYALMVDGETKANLLAPIGHPFGAVSEADDGSISCECSNLASELLSELLAC